MDIEIYLQHIENKDKMQKELQDIERNISKMINEVNVNIGKELYQTAIILFDPECNDAHSSIVKGSYYGDYYRSNSKHTIDYSFDVGKYLFRLLKDDKHITNGRFKHEINLVIVYGIIDKTYKFHVETYGWYGNAAIDSIILENALDEMFLYHVPGSKNEEVSLEAVKEGIKQLKEVLDNYHSFFIMSKLAEESI